MNEPETPHDGPPEADQVLDFVHGLLSPAERRALLQRAARDPQFEEQLRRASADLESMRASGGVRRAADGSLVPRVPASRRRPMAAFAGVLAAAVVLLLLLRPPVPSPSEAPSYWLPVEAHLVRARSGEGPVAGFGAALAAYGNHDATLAVEKLTALTAPAGLNDLRRIYLSSALLQSDDAAAAVSVLSELELPTLPQPWRDRASWVLYLSRHRLGMEEADELLADLSDAEGEVGDLARAERRRRGL